MAKSGAMWARGFPATWRLPPRVALLVFTSPYVSREHCECTWGRTPKPGCAQHRTTLQGGKTIPVQGWLQRERSFPAPWHQPLPERVWGAGWATVGQHGHPQPHLSSCSRAAGVKGQVLTPDTGIKS